MRRINFDWFKCHACKRYLLKWHGWYAGCRCGGVVLDALAIDARKRKR